MSRDEGTRHIRYKTLIIIINSRNSSMILPHSIAKRISYRQTSKSLINNIMCKAIDESKENNNVPSYSTAQYAGISTSFISNNIIRILRPPYTIKKVFLLLFLSVIGITSLYTFHSGFRRTIQFWRGMTPFILKYKWLKIKAEKIDHCTSDELEARLNVLRTEQAPKLVALIIRMGGIYVKIGHSYEYHWTRIVATAIC